MLLWRPFATGEFAAKFELSSLNMNDFLGCALRGRTALSEKTSEVLEEKMRWRKKRNFNLMLAVLDTPLLRKLGTEQVRQILQVSTAVHARVASVRLVRECYFRVSREKNAVRDLFDL